MSPLEAIEKYKKEIISSSRKTGVWASVTAAQLILESGNPMSALAMEGNNFFGIKWSPSHETKYPGAYGKDYSTQEDYGYGSVTIKAQFTHFPSVADGITEHSVIWWNGSYKEELDILENLNSTRDEFLREMANGPYATDKSYYSKLKSVIEKNNLDELDKLAFPEGRKFCGFGDRRVGSYKYPDDGYNGTASSVGSSEYDSKTGLSYVIVKEEDLVGMYPKSFFLDNSVSLSLPSYDNLSLDERANLNLIKENYKMQNSWSIWDLFRILVVFVGLSILVYAILFIVSFLFDRSNNLVDISLINVITLGKLEFSDEVQCPRGYVNMSRLLKIEVALLLVGFFLVSGGVFSVMLDVITYVNNMIG